MEPSDTYIWVILAVLATMAALVTLAHRIGRNL